VSNLVTMITISTESVQFCDCVPYSVELRDLFWLKSGIGVHTVPALLGGDLYCNPIYRQKTIGCGHRCSAVATGSSGLNREERATGSKRFLTWLQASRPISASRSNALAGLIRPIFHPTYPPVFT
jgi:hypothetical protein